MSLSLHIVRPVCRVLIGALLFAQAAFAARPCVEANMSAAAAIAAPSNHDCCEPAVTELSLCAAQCGDGNKLSGSTDVFRLHFLTVAGPVIPLPPQDSNTAFHPRLQRYLASGPPSILRFCRLLI